MSLTPTVMTRKNAVLGFALAVTGVLVMSFIAYAGHLPSRLSTNPIDKALHCSMAATLSFFLDRVLRGKALYPGWVIPRAAFVIVPIGIEEYLQRFSSQRSSSVGDFIADACGVALGIAISRVFFKR